MFVMHSGKIRVVFATMLALGTGGSAFCQIARITASPTTQPGSNPAPLTLTLDQAVRIAIANSKTLRIAQEGIDKARGRVNESKAQYLPSINATTNIYRFDRETSITFPDANGQPQTLVLNAQDQRSVGVSAVLPIDVSGLIGAAVSASQFQEIAARLEYSRTRNQLVSDVKSAYYDVLRAQAFVTVAETAYKNAQDRLSTAEAYLRAGTGTKFDVLRAQTEVANAQQNLIAAKDRVNLATAALNNALGLDQNTPLQVKPAHEETTSAPDFNQGLAEAYKQRPEVLQQDALIKAAEKGIKIAERSLLPGIGLSWNFSYQPDAAGFAPITTSWTAVAQITLPLFEGGLARARIQQARADVNSAKVNKQIVLDNIALDVRQSYLALVEAQERLRVANAALAEAEEQYRLAQVRYKAGVTQQPGTSPLLEVSDAQTALTQAQTNQVNAQYDVETAKARLDRALGRYAQSPK
ncbi:MAG: TolC family protein [Chthonomonadales bacterium]